MIASSLFLMHVLLFILPSVPLLYWLLLTLAFAFVTCRSTNTQQSTRRPRTRVYNKYCEPLWPALLLGRIASTVSWSQPWVLRQTGWTDRDVAWDVDWAGPISPPVITGGDRRRLGSLHGKRQWSWRRRLQANCRVRSIRVVHGSSLCEPIQPNPSADWPTQPNQTQCN